MKLYGFIAITLFGLSVAKPGPQQKAPEPRGLPIGLSPEAPIVGGPDAVPTVTAAAPAAPEAGPSTQPPDGKGPSTQAPVGPDAAPVAGAPAGDAPPEENPPAGANKRGIPAGPMLPMPSRVAHPGPENLQAREEPDSSALALDDIERKIADLEESMKSTAPNMNGRQKRQAPVMQNVAPARVAQDPAPAAPTAGLPGTDGAATPTDAPAKETTPAGGSAGFGTSLAEAPDNREAETKDAAPEGLVLEVQNPGQSNLTTGQLVDGNLQPVPGNGTGDLDLPGANATGPPIPGATPNGALPGEAGAEANATAPASSGVLDPEPKPASVLGQPAGQPAGGLLNIAPAQDRVQEEGGKGFNAKRQSTWAL